MMILQNINNKKMHQSRRSFLTRSIPVCTLGCLGLSQIFSSAIEPDIVKKPVHKFNKKTGYSYEQAYRFRARLYADRMKRIANYLGHDNLIDALKKSNEDYYTSIAKYKPENILQDFVRPFYEDEGYKIILTIEVIENREDLVSWKVTECLNAKVLLELDAAEIGYATLCHGDDAWARAFNPNIQFIRTKTLMEGHDCCDHCYKMSI
ncbi:MAG TPA: hypothetical protein DDW27_10215 [Bacteroidales bacterium]|nr:hypothetical protein [Bacteroidales bacterium]